MDERTTGLILRLTPLTETSLIVHWISPDLGRLTTVAKGARRPRSPFRGKLDLFHLADLSLRRSLRSQLHALLEVRLLESHPVLRRDWVRLQHAGYAAKLVEELTEAETPIPELYALLIGFVQQLVQRPASATTLLAFEAKVLQSQGLDLAYYPAPLTPTNRHLLNRLTALAWPALSCLRVPLEQANQLSHFIQVVLLATGSLRRIPKARDAALRAVLNETP